MENVMHFKTKSTEVQPAMQTQRDKEIPKLIAAEYTTQEIEDELFISFRTLENRRYSLLQKSGSKIVSAWLRPLFNMVWPELGCKLSCCFY